MVKQARIRVKGIVQGVGFRPFVYRSARRFGLAGIVRNTAAGVDIEVQGTASAIRRFSRHLARAKPGPARIDEMVLTMSRPKRRLRDFRIIESRPGRGFTQLSPDIAVCEKCRREFSSPKDRRYGFPFINCTDCGPRYSIIIDTPYDRDRTSMRSFEMCGQCAAEFCDINDRRFHAQPDCCHACGPEFKLRSAGGRIFKAADPIGEAALLLGRGEILAIKGIGGYHIACDATACRTVRRLRRLKNRPRKPFAVMMNRRDVPKFADISAREMAVLQSPAAPIVLVKKKGEIICDEVAPQNPYIGIMLPYAPLHYRLLEKVPCLVMTSANIQDEPIVISERQVERKLGRIVRFYLAHNRPILNRCDDSVGLVLPEYGFSIIRRSRGYAPIPVRLPFRVRPTLAVGPLLKNTFTLADRQEAYVSPHIGDLDNLETLLFFREMTAKYKRWFKIEPEIIAHDLHPDYMSTRIARSMKGKKVAIQHHIAHIAACLGENGACGPAIGIAFDGTGYGHDGTIWGGEFFVGTVHELKRAAHLEYMPLPGGEESIRNPTRIAMAYLYKNGLSYPEGIRRSPPGHAKAVARAVGSNWNLAWTSSMGRLFDCVSAMAGFEREITFEAEAAIRLEHAAGRGIRAYYPYELDEGEMLIIKTGRILAAILEDIEKNASVPVIAAKFHNTVARFSLDICRRLRKIYSMKNVALSGGVFQNRYLLVSMISMLKADGFQVLTHKQLPTNDGCISYGQVIYGNGRSAGQG